MPKPRWTRCSIGPKRAFKVTPALRKRKKEGRLVESGALFAIRADHLEELVGSLAMKEGRLASCLVACVSKTDHQFFEPDLHHLVEETMNRVGIQPHRRGSFWWSPESHDRQGSLILN